MNPHGQPSTLIGKQKANGEVQSSWKMSTIYRRKNSVTEKSLFFKCQTKCSFIQKLSMNNNSRNDGE